MRREPGTALLVSFGLIIAACGGTSAASTNPSSATTAVIKRESTLQISANKSSSIVAGKNVPQQVNDAFYLSKSIEETVPGTDDKIFQLVPPFSLSKMDELGPEPFCCDT